jgi:cardiolipin synthase
VFRLVALGLFVVMVVGDGLDGFFARRLKQRTIMGAFLDPLGDKLMMFSAYVFLAGRYWAPPRMPLWVSTVVISRDILIGLGFLTIFVMTGRFRMVSPSGVGKLCTLVQALTIIAVLGAPWLVELAGAEPGHGVLNGLWLFTVFITLFSGVDYLYAGRVYLLHSDQVTLTVEDRPGRD